MEDETDYDGVIPAGEIRNCKCGKKARVLLSWSEKNPGRRFFRCEGNQCSYFHWYDEEYSQHIKAMLNKLKRGETARNKEGEYLRMEIFRLQYLMEHASTLDAVQLEKQHKEMKMEKMKLESELSEVRTELKTEMKKNALEMKDYVNQISSLKKQKEIFNYFTIAVVAVLISMIIFMQF
ncbi:uncharacterized protein At4g04775-like [Mercurialis annua]|uniref:uncharacterized protein At4g04775-like n=1 Tax=Mercurialis annua TaxID=3986 RepID=UPI0024AF3DE9|nr:uncharacterized protein At4g04775-like [Mercurialis annua]